VAVGHAFGSQERHRLVEVRSRLENRIARVLFAIHENVMLLLHGFIKKSQKIPADDLRLAKQRLSKTRNQR
jgi:phage-related protein